MSLLNEYQAQLADLRKRDVPLATFECPDCGAEIHTPKPPQAATFGSAKGVRTPPWEADMECPHCTAMFHKTVYATGHVDVTEIG